MQDNGLEIKCIWKITLGVSVLHFCTRSYRSLCSAPTLHTSTDNDSVLVGIKIKDFTRWISLDSIPKCIIIYSDILNFKHYTVVLTYVN